MQQHCPYSWLSVSCRSLNYPTSRLFKKWNKHILCFFDFSLVLFSHLILPINKHEALLLPHSYMQSLLFYCDIFLTTRFKINIHNHQNSSNVQQYRSYWLLKKTKTLAGYERHSVLSAPSWTWIYFHTCRLVPFMFGHISPAVRVSHLIPLSLLAIKKRCSQ